MYRLRFLFLVLVIAIGPGCNASRPDHQIIQADFSFSYPQDWQRMSELWPNYQSKANYMNFGLDEIVMITSVRKQGESGAWFAVARAPLSAADLSAQFAQTYAQPVPEIKDAVQSEIDVNGISGLEMRYRRPWGEPWWEFRDIWLEKDGNVYLLSFHAANLEKYQQNMDIIITSFAFP